LNRGPRITIKINFAGRLKARGKKDTTLDVHLNDTVESLLSRMAQIAEKQPSELTVHFSANRLDASAGE